MQKVSNPNETINAILPHYTAFGDQTEIHAVDCASAIVPVKVKTVIRQLAGRQAVDLCRLKSAAAGLTKSMIWQPLVLAPDLVLVPLKVRRPKICGDATGGYFNFCQIKSTRAACGHTLIQCKNGEEIPVLWKQNTVDDHLLRAHLATLAQGSQSLPLEKWIQLFAQAALAMIQRPTH